MTKSRGQMPDARVRRRLIAVSVALSSFTVSDIPAQVTTGSRTTPVVTLTEARRAALAVDPFAIEATQRVHAVGWERRAARIDLLVPRVTTNLNYIRFSDPFFNFGTGAISPNAASATLEANYTILGAGKLGQVKSRTAALESAEANETVSRFQSALETDAAYFAVLASHELARVAADRVKRAEEQLAVARVRVVAGEAIASDSLQLLLELIRARFTLLQQDSAVVASRLFLGSRVGLTGPAEAAPIDTTMPPELPFSEAQAVEELRTRGPDVEAARADERSADAALSTARERYIPALTLGYTYGAYDSELFPSALKRSQVSLGVVFPIWDGGLREISVARSAAERNVARARRDELERASAERIAQAYLGYQTAKQGIVLAQVGVAAATETFRVQQARYGEGATIIIELLEAQEALSESEAGLVRARFAARLALSQIEALLGRRVFEAGQ